MNTTTIHQNLLRLAMTLLMAVMTSALAWAQDPIVTGFAATSGTAGTDENENYAKLVDGDRTTKWCITQFSGCYIEFEANEAFVPSAYILTTGNDNADSRRHGRNPKNWVLKAKTNKHDPWVTIANVTGDNVLQDVNTTDYEFSIANSGIYRYFRLEVSAVKSGSTFQLGELRFRGHSPKESELVGVTLDERIQYITDVKLIGGSQSEVNSLANNYALKGWLVNEQNLNEGASGDVIYLLYKMGSIATANQSFITDIYLTTVSKSEDTPGSLDYGDRHYTLASYDGSSNFKKYKGNLNNGVSGGDQIHLYYTTDISTEDYKAISSIIFNRESSGAVGKNGSTTGYNLNNKGHVIYMHCPRNYAPLWKIEKSTDGGRCIINGFETNRVIKKSSIKAFPSILGGAQVVDFSINLSQFENLKTVYFNEDLKTPEMISMSGCANLQHIHTVDNNGNVIYRDELPSCITSIPNGGFSGCTSLTNITIPGTVTSIPDGAFTGCTGLTSVIIEDGVKSIGQGAFNGCTNLESLSIPGSVTSIEPYLFKDYTFLKSVTIEDGVTSIGDGAFSGCTGLTSVTFPASVTSIGENAFDGCSKLAEINVNNDNPNYKSIQGVLLNKEGTTILLFPAAYPNKNYVIPDGVTNIGGIFTGRKDLTGITIPGSVESIGDKAFWYCIALKSVTIENGVKSIGEQAFYNCYCSLKSIIIPGSVTSIGESAFEECNALTSIIIPDNVESIGGRAFDSCTSLTSIIIPGSVESIGDGAFQYCSALKSVTIENGVESIGKYTFHECTSLTSITIPGSVKSIGQEAFLECTSLENITIPSSVTSIGKEAFRQCTSLESVTIPVSVTSIDNGAFSGCTSLESITIPGSVTSIGDRAFWCCSALASIIIPGSVDYIDDNAFSGCTSLKSVTIENGVENIYDEAFFGCSSLTSITIPGSVERIWDGAFSGCTSLESVTIENGVENIFDEAFFGCSSLTSITIPGSVKRIWEKAFWACDNLASVSIMGNPKIDKDAFPDGATVTLSLTANAANGAKWMTFYNDRYNFQADENTTVYKATVSGQSLVLTEVADKIVNGAEWSWDKITAPGTAVILKSTGNPVMTRTMAKSSDTQANALLGTMEATATPANTYTLASGSKGVGFYRYTGSKVAAGKAYIIHNGASAAREFFGFDESGEATGISTITVPATLEGNGSAWYGLDGRKLQGEPAKKGIYMRNGRKVVIK